MEKLGFENVKGQGYVMKTAQAVVKPAVVPEEPTATRAAKGGKQPLNIKADVTEAVFQKFFNKQKEMAEAIKQKHNRGS